MNKIFLDIGFGQGESTQHFIDIIPDYDTYKIYAFDSDPRNTIYFDLYKNLSNIKFYTDVMWIYDGLVRFYFGINSCGSTTIKEKTTGFINSENSKELKCIDISTFIQNNFKKDDYIILKLDIEGGEYKVLERLIQTNIIEYIDDLFVEFHRDKISKCLQPNEDENLIRQLKDLFGFKYVNIPWEKETIKLNMLTLYENNN